MTPQEKIEELEERIRQMKEAIAPPILFPFEWKLTRQQSKILSGLCKRSVFTSTQFEYCHEFEDSERDDDDILAVQIVHMRRKLAPFGIEIETVYGLGFMLSPSMKRLVLRLADEQLDKHRQTLGLVNTVVEKSKEVIPFPTSASDSKSANATGSIPQG